MPLRGSGEHGKRGGRFTFSDGGWDDIVRGLMYLFIIQSPDQPNGIDEIIIVIGILGFQQRGPVRAGSMIGRRRGGLAD